MWNLWADRRCQLALTAAQYINPRGEDTDSDGWGPGGGGGARRCTTAALFVAPRGSGVFNWLGGGVSIEPQKLMTFLSPETLWWPLGGNVVSCLSG